jgi:hypothetical protein
MANKYFVPDVAIGTGGLAGIPGRMLRSGGRGYSAPNARAANAPPPGRRRGPRGGP